MRTLIDLPVNHEMLTDLLTNLEKVTVNPKYIIMFSVHNGITYVHIKGYHSPIPITWDIDYAKKQIHKAPVMWRNEEQMDIKIFIIWICFLICFVGMNIAGEQYSKLAYNLWTIAAGLLLLLFIIIILTG